MKRIKIRKHACKTENKNRSNKKKKRKKAWIYTSPIHHLTAGNKGKDGNKIPINV